MPQASKTFIISNRAMLGGCVNFSTRTCEFIPGVSLIFRGRIWPVGLQLTWIWFGLIVFWKV